MWKNRKKGFTLIEVIIVIGIIAILAAIAVPSLTRYVGAAEKRDIQATAHNIQIVLQAEKSDNYGQQFTGTDGNAAMYADGKTYNAILKENGVIIGADRDALTDIQWDSSNHNVLSGFKYTTAKYSITYANGKFGAVEKVSK